VFGYHNLAINTGGGEGGKYTMGVRSLNLYMSQVRKRGKIGSNQPLMYTYPFLTLTTIFLVAPISTYKLKNNYS